MFAPAEFQRRLASLERAEATRCGAVPPSFAAIALARRLVHRKADVSGAVDPIAASASARPLLFRS